MPTAAERRAFQTGSDQFEIIMHPDGSVTIEASGDYGDSEIGWGSTTVVLHLEPPQVAALKQFLFQTQTR